MRARYIIAAFAIPLVVVGIILVADLPAKVGLGFSAPDWGYTLFSLGADIVIVYLVIDLLVLREERESWKAVESKVMQLIESHLEVLLVEISSLCGAYEPSTSGDKEIANKSVEGGSQQMLARIRRLADAKNRDELRKEVDEHLFRTLSEPQSIAPGSVIAFLSDSPRRLGNLLLRYPQKLLEPELVELMLKLETELEELNWYVRGAMRRDSFAKASEWMVVIVLQRLLGILVKAVDDKVISLPEYS